MQTIEKLGIFVYTLIITLRVLLMNKYRKEARQIAKDTSWTFWRFLPIFIVAIIVLAVLLFGLRSAGIIGSTIVERKVFEESYQRSESLKSGLATFEAQLAEINSKLSNPSIDEVTRNSLQAQKAGLNIRIKTLRSKIR